MVSMFLEITFLSVRIEFYGQKNHRDNIATASKRALNRSLSTKLLKSTVMGIAYMAEMPENCKQK